MMPLTLRRKRDETWLDAALRRADNYGLRSDIRVTYHKHKAAGATDAQAAWAALSDLDLLQHETPGRGGWPIIDGELCCPACLSSDVDLTCRYPAFGTGPGGRGRLGDPGAREINECRACGETCSFPGGIRA